MPLIKVASVGDVRPGNAKTVSAKGEEIALYNVGGRFFATTNTCAHRGGPLGEGSLDDKVITCPWHGWRFDVTTGISPVNPAARVQTYNVVVQGNDVFVDLP